MLNFYFVFFFKWDLTVNQEQLMYVILKPGQSFWTSFVERFLSFLLMSCFVYLISLCFNSQLCSSVYRFDLWSDFLRSPSIIVSCDLNFVTLVLFFLFRKKHCLVQLHHLHSSSGLPQAEHQTRQLKMHDLEMRNSTFFHPHSQHSSHLLLHRHLVSKEGAVVVE